MLDATNQVLQSYAGRTLASEVPEFARNNYFLSPSTYNRNVEVYRFYTDTLSLKHWFNGQEWGLFRGYLDNPRDTYQGGNSGVALIDQVVQFPVNGPPVGTTNAIDNLGTAYVEFYPTNLNLPIGKTADLSVTVIVKKWAGGEDPRVNVIPIASFTSMPEPGNNFISPVISVEGTYLVYTYTSTIRNFNQFNRVAVMITSFGGPNPYSYRAAIALR